jgi:hypothetical protein
MEKSTKHRVLSRASRKPLLSWHYGTNAKGLLLALLAVATMLPSCGGGASSSGSQQSATLSGNWQFTMAPQTDGNSGDPTFSGGLQGGFLLQNNGSITGQTVYSVTSSTSTTGPCNSGSAPVAVTASGQNVTITEVAGTQTFTLTGTLSSDGSTMMGTYTSTAGTAPDGSACGYAETGLSWSAVSVSPITGPIQGSFHSTSQNSGLSNQDFAVSGSVTQGENIGASNATVTGTLTFVNPATNLSDYPCFSNAAVNGQISGNFVILQIIGFNGATVGQIGEPVGSPTGINPVTFSSAQGGYILQGAGPSYMVATGNCPGSLGDTTLAGDAGNICLALNSTTACQEPITLTPAVVTFPAQTLNTAATSQTITLTNNSGSALNGLTLSWLYNGDNQFGQTDFDGIASLTEKDACGAGGAPSQGNPFDLGSGQSCSITTTFSPQEGCPWIPFPYQSNPPGITGIAPEYCPFPQTATVTVNNVSGADPDTSFAVPITGIGLSAIQPSTPELDFGAEEPLNPPEMSPPQTLSFTNSSVNPVQILGSAPCVNPPKGSLTLPHPLLATSRVAGLQVVGTPPGVANSITADGDTIQYNCDSDSGTSLPNFQISSDTCTGALLAPQATCSVQVKYVPQPNTDINSGLDYFLELNTIQCTNAPNDPPSPPNCEIDSGRFPVALKANKPSPLRMSPGAGLDFGNVSKGTTSAPLTVTLLNDPALTNPQTVTFVGAIGVTGNYSIPTGGNTCPATLAPGSQCTVTVTFTPGGVGFEPGTLTINYSPEPTGQPQVVYLRGTGQ